MVRCNMETIFTGSKANVNTILVHCNKRPDFHPRPIRLSFLPRIRQNIDGS